MVLSVLRKLILQTRMRGHPVGLDVLFCVYFHTSCVQNREGSGETARDAQARLSHRWDSRLCDKYQDLLSWLKFPIQIKTLRRWEIWLCGALSQSVWSSGLKEARGRLLVNLVPMLEQEKKKKKWEV